MTLQLKSDSFFKNIEENICSEIRAPQEAYPEHSHDFHELIIVTKGVGQHILNDVPTNLSKNYICYISPNDRHQYEQVNDLHLTNILFKKNKLSYSPLLKQLLPHDREKVNHWFISTETMNRVDHIVEKIGTESLSQRIDSRLMTEALFQQLVVEISRGRLNAHSQNVTDNTILRVVDWLHNNYSEEICINDISKQFHISSRTLSRQIKQVTNLTFNNYVHRVRINNAMNLLQYSDLSITDIAFQVGYKDSNYFSTKFKRFTNSSPSQYR